MSTEPAGAFAMEFVSGVALSGWLWAVPDVVVAEKNFATSENALKSGIARKRVNLFLAPDTSYQG